MNLKTILTKIRHLYNGKFFEQDEFEVMKDEKESFCQPKFILFAFAGAFMINRK